MNKMLCITVLIMKTYNVKIMLNMLTITIESRIRAKALIEFCISHRDVARVFNFVYHNTQIIAKIFTYIV